MNENQFGITMGEARKKLLTGKDSFLYREFEGGYNGGIGDLKDQFYKYNYRLFALFVFVGFFFSISFTILFFTFLWYKPLCHALHLKNRVKRYNIENFRIYKGLE